MDFLLDNLGKIQTALRVLLASKTLRNFQIPLPNLYNSKCRGQSLVRYDAHCTQDVHSL